MAQQNEEDVEEEYSDEEEREAEAHRERLWRREQERKAAQALEAARAATARVSQDVPLGPTSDTNPLPILPAESGDELSPGQRIALAAIISGSTFSMAARAAGVDRRTVYRWRHEPAFKRVLDELNDEAMTTISIRVRNLMMKTTRVLSDALSSDNVSCALRIANSARLWAQLNQGAREEDEFETKRESVANRKEEVEERAKPQAACPLRTGSDRPVSESSSRPNRGLNPTAYSKIASAVRFPRGDVVPVATVPRKSGAGMFAL